MVAFEVFNATLWSLLTAINKMEGESCSVQLLRAYENSTGIYGQRSQFLDVSVEMTSRLSMPIMLVDYSRGIADKLTMKLKPYKNILEMYVHVYGSDRGRGDSKIWVLGGGKAFLLNKILGLGV